MSLQGLELLFTIIQSGLRFMLNHLNPSAMKNYFTLFFALICSALCAQTNVSGGIYNNTTWTLANSPYIVTDTIVVFPGVTLTIEPGVTVKFDDGKFVEVRQGSLIATGTSADTITITSNSASPVKGIYKGFHFTNPVAITIDYCIFKYADNPLDYCCNTIDTLYIKHSYFYENNKCLSSNYCKTVISQSNFYANTYCIDYSPQLITVRQSLFESNVNCFGDNNNEEVSRLDMDSCTFIDNHEAAHIDTYCHITNCQFLNNYHAIEINMGSGHFIKNCLFCNNQSGVNFAISAGNNDTLINCSFSNNGFALSAMLAYMTGNIFSDNNMGLDLRINATDSIFNNYIFHNRIGLYYRGGAGPSFFNNYICNNSDYNIDYITSLNGTIVPVCFCETDSATIRSKIYDGYVDITRGLLDFTPFVNCDSSGITALQPVSCPAIVITEVQENNTMSKDMIGIYPNPTFSSFTIENISAQSHLQILNSLGQIVYSEKLTGKDEQVIDAHLATGIYFVQVNNRKERITVKLAVQ
jgi:hypothetical protein